MCGIVLCFNKCQQQICVEAISVKGGALAPSSPLRAPCLSQKYDWRHVVDTIFQLYMSVGPGIRLKSMSVRSGR